MPERKYLRRFGRRLDILLMPGEKKSAYIYTRLSRALYDALIAEAGEGEPYAPIVRKALKQHLALRGHPVLSSNGVSPAAPQSGTHGPGPAGATASPPHWRGEQSPGAGSQSSRRDKSRPVRQRSPHR